MRLGERGRASLPERVAQAYYTHGVFIAAHPFPVIATAVTLVLLSCIPLVNLPLPSNVPQMYTEESGNSTEAEVPKWVTLSEPTVYVQQVIMKSAVSPWNGDMLLTDAIRAPLAETFRLVEAIQNYQHPKSGKTLSNVCVKVETPTRNVPLPQYSCLVVSPANMWRRDAHEFYMDTHLVSTVYNYQGIHIGKVSLAELFFGLSLKDAGMKRYPLRNRQRIIQFAVTLLLSNYDVEYVEGLKQHLKSLYPLHQENGNSTSGPHQNIVHVYYPGDFDFHEFLPLFFTYFMLYFYMYFSVRKIELVRSKVGMALSAVFTVIASLVMSIGLCLFFGLDPAGSSRGREVFPYLVVVVGLENILVLTKSVVSTPAHLDAKIRVAQGLSKEGWSITKNLLTEVTILTAGLFTLVPAIQEFCIFAMVGLLCDFFLQVCFFATVLSLDVRRIEAAEERRRGRASALVGPAGAQGPSAAPSSILPRSRSTPRLHQDQPSGPIQSNTPSNSNSHQNKIPKRLRLVHFWASTRIVQRAFMLCMVVWIGGIVYSAGIIQHFVQIPEDAMGNMDSKGHSIGRGRNGMPGRNTGTSMFGQFHQNQPGGVNQQLNKSEWGPGWSRGLAPVKWCYLVGVYNSSGGGSGGPCRLAVAGPLRLASPVPPATARALRNPADPLDRPFHWNSLAHALDPADYPGEGDEGWPGGARDWETPYLPTSPLEVLLVTALCVISVVVIAYTALALYHCICSRNYAQWRSAWGSPPTQDTTQVVLEAVPLILEGHNAPVELLASDGNTLTSVCLAGEVNVWDATTGERLAHVDRKQYFMNQLSKKIAVENEDQVMSDYESGSPPSLKDNYLRNGKRKVTTNIEPEVMFELTNRKPDFPDLTSAINTNFTNAIEIRKNSVPQIKELSNEGFDYGPLIKQLYKEVRDAEWDDGMGAEEDDGSLESLIEDDSSACPAVWCMDSMDNLIVLGTNSGRLEFWQANTAKFKCIYDDYCGVGVLCIKLSGNRVVLSRLNGGLEVLNIEWGPQYGQPTYRRLGHSRAASAGRAEDFGYRSSGGGCDLRCTRLWAVRAHQQPITQLQVEAGRILTGSHDHTLKVFSLLDQLLVFTLHGHCGPITSLFIDSVNPLMAGSGSQDGTLCVWDLLTGACVYSLDAHDGPVTALTYSASYVISLGSDERLCVWDRFQGHLLNTIQVPQMFCTSMAMLTHNLLIASKQGSLVIWDVRTGEVVRIVKLGHWDECTLVRTVLPLRDSVACDYDNQARIVRFPLVRDKTD